MLHECVMVMAKHNNVRGVLPILLLIVLAHLVCEDIEVPLFMYEPQCLPIKIQDVFFLHALVGYYITVVVITSCCKHRRDILQFIQHRGDVYIAGM